MNHQRNSWRNVHAEIKGWLLNARYLPGEKLPRDEDIAQQIGCARSTVVRAMQELSAEGMVDRKRKGGTLVSPHRVSRATLEIPVHRIDIEARGMTYSHSVLSQSQATPPADILKRFQSETLPPCQHVQALHLGDDLPFLYEDRWIAVPVPSGILDSQSANEWLVAHCPYDRIDVSCSAIAADDRLAQALGTPPGTAHFCLRRTTWAGAQPITTVDSYYQAGHVLTFSS